MGRFPAPRCSSLAVLMLAGVLARCAHAQVPHRSADESSFEAARAQSDAGARIQALRQYLVAYPKGSRQSAAQQLLLEAYLASTPTNTVEIHTLASAQIAAASPGFDRWTEEARVAALLANAGSAGADLQDARIWAQDAVDSLTENSYRREMAAAQARYKLPRLPQKQLHAQFLEYRASFLAALASVDLREGQEARATPLLEEAYRLEPLSGDVNALNGELALAQNRKADALLSFERADAMGDLASTWRTQELDLFTELHHGGRSELDKQVDGVYRSLYPPVFTLPKRELAPGGHTVLLELFTGSGCLPCTAPDLAIDSLLHSYTRQDLVVLAYDEHIPRPDPLTAPDGVLRAAAYGVTSTPAAFLDGQPVEVLGAARGDVDNVVIGFADPVEESAAIPSGLQLSVSVQKGAAGQVLAYPLLSSRTLSPAEAKVAGADFSLRKLAQADLYVALVQDDVRYSGENGVRFHRMVVRALQQLPAAAYLNAGNRLSPVTFDPVILDTEQVAYLKNYEKSNDRFGNFRFATTDLPIAGGDLAVVAWVQDPATKHVLQTAFTTVPAP